MNLKHHHSWLKKVVTTDYQTKNHRLMVKAGLIFQTAAGIYTWLPHGLKALQKLSHLCRRYLNANGCSEVMMPHILSAQLLKASGRQRAFGEDMLAMQDRKGHAMYFGPTHEEPIVHCLKSYLHSYKQLPQSLYQIQTKFRDELRPRGGVVRSREFLMLDAYSFHATQECLNTTYRAMREAFQAILRDLGLAYITAQADSGAIGGESSEELQVISPIGENVIFVSSTHQYAANIETATYALERRPAVQVQSIIAHYFSNGKEYLKVMIGNPYTPNLTKINKLTRQVYVPVAAAEIDHDKLTILYDYSSKALLAETGHQYVDVRNVIPGDYAIDGGTLSSLKSIEVGHIFDLGDHYSQKMHLEVTTPQNQSIPVLMGCYGLGLSRLLGVCIEMHSTAEEIRWPPSIQPYDLAIIPLGQNNLEKAQALYTLVGQRLHKSIFLSSGGSDASNIKNARILGCPYLLLVKDESYVLRPLDQEQDQVIAHAQIETLFQMLEQLL